MKTLGSLATGTATSAATVLGEALSRPPGLTRCAHLISLASRLLELAAEEAARTPSEEIPGSDRGELRLLAERSIELRASLERRLAR